MAGRGERVIRAIPHSVLRLRANFIPPTTEQTGDETVLLDQVRRGVHVRACASSSAGNAAAIPRPTVASVREQHPPVVLRRRKKKKEEGGGHGGGGGGGDARCVCVCVCVCGELNFAFVCYVLLQRWSRHRIVRVCVCVCVCVCARAPVCV
jgi:hypothetical protein